MTRCIQVGTITFQGRATDIKDGFGKVDTGLRVVWGRLIDGKECGNA